MKSLRSSLLIAVIFLFSISVATAQDKVQIIHAGTLLAVPGEKPLKEQTVLIKNGMVESVQSGYISAQKLGYEGSEITDLKNKFVLPGFIDMHTHVTGERDPNANPHEWTTQNDQDLAYKSIPYLERTLQAGFTTVRNLGLMLN
ncbi:MAG: amidohydrolase family protein [Balneola sp.]